MRQICPACGRPFADGAIIPHRESGLGPRQHRIPPPPIPGTGTRAVRLAAYRTDLSDPRWTCRASTGPGRNGCPAPTATAGDGRLPRPGRVPDRFRPAAERAAAAARLRRRRVIASTKITVSPVLMASRMGLAIPRAAAQIATPATSPAPARSRTRLRFSGLGTTHARSRTRAYSTSAVAFAYSSSTCVPISLGTREPHAVRLNSCRQSSNAHRDWRPRQGHLPLPMPASGKGGRPADLRIGGTDSCRSSLT